MAAYWYPSNAGDNKCELVKYPTQYSLYDRDDYKRCICDNFGNPDTDCEFQYVYIPDGSCEWVNTDFKYQFFDAYIGQGSNIIEAWDEFEFWNYITREPVCTNLNVKYDFFLLKLIWNNDYDEISEDQSLKEFYKVESDRHIEQSDINLLRPIYKANNFEQQSIIFGPNHRNFFSFPFERLDLGTWEYEIRACRDSS